MEGKIYITYKKSDTWHQLKNIYEWKDEIEC